LEDLEAKKLEFTSTGDFLTDLKREFGEGNNKSAKVAELKRVEHKLKKIKEFV